MFTRELFRLIIYFEFFSAYCAGISVFLCDWTKLKKSTLLDAEINVFGDDKMMCT
jgi:hypothetical protein